MKKIYYSFWSRLADTIAPRACCVCHNRLAISEEVICASCNIRLPRTRFAASPRDNEMAQNFWIQTPVEKAAALFYYSPRSETANIIYDMKYHHRPEIGTFMGRQTAAEFMQHHFFDDIDVIVPVPISKKRRKQRGYNQSEMIAQGVSEVSGVPVDTTIVSRGIFVDSQTHKHRWGRLENVATAFHLDKPEAVKGKHVLIVDDIITTGATLIALANEIQKAGDVKFSFLSLGYTKS